MTTKEVLARARELISDPNHWTKGDYSKYSANGMTYCAIGAIEEITDNYEDLSNATWHLNETVRSRGLYFSTISYNDSPDTTHADILNLFDLAIANCKD